VARPQRDLIFTRPRARRLSWCLASSQPQKLRFAPDSPLEETRIEPLVPLVKLISPRPTAELGTASRVSGGSNREQGERFVGDDCFELLFGGTGPRDVGRARLGRNMIDSVPAQGVIVDREFPRLL
jgi:hypothetical protein